MKKLHSENAREQWTCLRQGKCGGKINQEISLQIPHRDLPRIHDEVTPAENPRARRDEGGPELHDHVQQVEEVGDRA